MSKQARIFNDLLQLSDKMLEQVQAMYENHRQLLNRDEIEAIEAMIALSED